MRAGVAAVGWFLLFVVLTAWPLLLLSVWGPPMAQSTAQPISIADVASGIKADRFVSVQVASEWGAATDRSGDVFVFKLEHGTTPLHVLGALGVTPAQLSRVRYTVLDPPPLLALVQALSGVVPLLIMAGLWWAAAPGPATNTNELLMLSQHRPHRALPQRTRFDDVAGVDEAKCELQEIVDFLVYPQRYAALGAHVPRGVLLVGPPGSGKTLLARAVAGEARVPFFTMSGAEFVEIVAGLGASRVRDLFRRAASSAPAIVFVDEIDAIGRRRGAAGGPSNDERDQTLNQILVEMDGFDAQRNVIVMAATNRVDVLDPALLRPGRFDRQIAISMPDVAGREAILRVHARTKPVDPAIDLNVIARLTSGFSGADLANLLNESAILAARESRRSIALRDVEESIERVAGGPPARSRPMRAADLERAAYHEAGRALVLHRLDRDQRVERVSIVRRNQTTGSTRSVALWEDDARLTVGQLRCRLTATLASRAAEQIVYGEVGTGTERDLERATEIARSMVTRYGMSQRLGTVAFTRGSNGRNYSDRMAAEIDAEIHRLLEAAERDARALIGPRRSTLGALAVALIEHETLQGDALQRLLRRA
jgi:cell division protease FtsH